MKTGPWVHVAVDGGEVSTSLLAEIAPNGLVCQLDGLGAPSLNEFYIAVEKAVPLISGFGRNLDALVDLIRTFGWGDYAGKAHCLVWRGPEIMMHASPEDFFQVVDILVGVSKELLVGEELDPTFDANNANDWIPTRLDLVFLVASTQQARTLTSRLQRLSDDWSNAFRTLSIPVDLRL